jgi:hypothetical protein
MAGDCAKNIQILETKAGNLPDPALAKLRAHPVNLLCRVYRICEAPLALGVTGIG